MLTTIQSELRLPISLQSRGKIEEEREAGWKPAPPLLTCNSVFTKWQSSAFVKDGFINRSCITIAGRDWVCCLIPACPPLHTDIHQPDATSVINYLQTCVLAPDKCVLHIEKCVKAVCQWRFVAPFAFTNDGKPHKQMSPGSLSGGTCEPRVTRLMSRGEEWADSFKECATHFMVVGSASGNEKIPVVNDTL